MEVIVKGFSGSAIEERSWTETKFWLVGMGLEWVFSFNPGFMEFLDLKNFIDQFNTNLNLSAYRSYLAKWDAVFFFKTFPIDDNGNLLELGIAEIYEIYRLSALCKACCG